MFPSDELAPSGRLARVFACTSIPEGLLVKGLLQCEGITVFVKGESEGPYRVGPMYLWVPEEFEVQARLLIEEARSGSGATQDDDIGLGPGGPTGMRDRLD